MAGPNFRSCRMCKGVFEYIGKPVCPKCLQKLDDDFIKVRDYIYEEPSASMMQIIEQTGVDERVVMDFLREGRLSLSSSSGALVCERCRKPIMSGRFCDECKNAFSKQFSAMSESMGPAKAERKDNGDTYRNQPRMHIDTSRNNR